MMTLTSLGDLLEAVDQLGLEDQENLVDILRRRIAERRRAALIAEVVEAEQEFFDGKCWAVSTEDLIAEIKS